MGPPTSAVTSLQTSQDQKQNMEAMLQITKAAGSASRAKDNEKNLTDASAGELFKYVIAIGIKHGALARDTLPEVLNVRFHRLKTLPSGSLRVPWGI